MQPISSSIVFLLQNGKGRHFLSDGSKEMAEFSLVAHNLHACGLASAFRACRPGSPFPVAIARTVASFVQKDLDMAFMGMALSGFVYLCLPNILISSPGVSTLKTSTEMHAS